MKVWIGFQVFLCCYFDFVFISFIYLFFFCSLFCFVVCGGDVVAVVLFCFCLFVFYLLSFFAAQISRGQPFGKNIWRKNDGRHFVTCPGASYARFYRPLWTTVVFLVVRQLTVFVISRFKSWTVTLSCTTNYKRMETRSSLLHVAQS